ncbi:MAG: dTDP-4-amino-4,6-dideoxygalactose transaminase [Candidatus Eremiobacteraeota bacterium]|nr:dTDP-4-amino-4,6-dideoxygalactose transaminase [Candidatus Eremiobacteraeota bacterium]
MSEERTPWRQAGPVPDIPFNKPSFVGPEQAYIAQAIANRHVSGDGPFTKSVEKLLERALHVPRALLTTSCTDALELAALVLGVQPGDEVIMPAFTFVSTANAFVLRGAKPIFADIRPDTLNIDEKDVERLITPATKAVIVVHYAGVACDMDRICAVARERGIAVVEDNAHGLYARYRNRLLGTIGVLGTQSFHETKNFTCGEGGALIINDPSMIERAEIHREKGTNRSRFLRGQVDKYTWVDVGSSYVLSDLLAAFLLAQLEAREPIQTTRARIWNRYASELSAWAQRWGVRLPVVPAECEQAYHLFYMLLPSLNDRQALIAHLAARKIAAVFHYMPLNRSEMAERLGAVADCPVTEEVADRLLRLPFYNDMTGGEQTAVIEAICSFEPRTTVAGRRS